MASRQHRHHHRHHRHNPAFNPGEHRHHRHHRGNPIGIPSVYGLDVVDTLWKAGGLAITQFLDQQFVFPIANNLFKTNPGTMGGKGLDVATTLASAVIAKEGAGLLSRQVGEDFLIGGGILTGGKALAAATGNAISIGAQFPSAFSRFGLPGGAPAPVRPAGAPTAPAPAATTVAALPPGGQANYPRPATVDSDVGL